MGRPRVHSERLNLTVPLDIFSMPGNCPFEKRKSQIGINGGRGAVESCLPRLPAPSLWEFHEKPFLPDPESP